ncbi:MAG: hypothetical protein DME26_16550 [Verrucomicrobia bacterium]|nr:MAG: hypothetical protein DME26_16550 [Verrucomicrobiota bacterium]
MIGYFIVMVVTISTIAGLGAYVAQSTSVAHRRNDMIATIQYANAGAVIACNDLNGAVTNTSGSLNSRLVNQGYTVNSSASTSSQTVYERTISSPFTNQTATAQIWLPTGSSPTTARIVATATKGTVTQKATANVNMTWAFPGAIISTNPGTKNTAVTKNTSSGNVVVNGDKTGPIVVDGGSGLAILANGYVNLDPLYTTNIPKSAISGTNFGTANEIPDYTAQGTANTLFDFARYTAVADLTTNALNPKGNNHFTNLLTFFTANNRAFTNAAKSLEGVIVVDIAGKDSNLGNLDPSHLPNGINIKGTLFFNFDSSFGPSDKVFNTATMNINPANLTGFVATNSTTYTSGYPPVYYDNTKNPTNINITSKGFANVAPDEDLPALLYSIGILDIHGNANVCGVMYTPSFVEIENKLDNQIQYFKGSIIMGLGIYFENVHKSSSVISFDPKTIDSIATLGSAGKQLRVAYWQ